MVNECLLFPNFGTLVWVLGGTRVLYSAEMLQTTKLLAIYGRDAVEITPGCDVDFVGKGLIRFVLEYGCITFDRMTATNMLKLERMQYRCLRIALELMQCTHVQTLEVIDGMSPLRLRFSMLYHKYLISDFLAGGNLV
jgi:hypothetical protein